MAQSSSPRGAKSDVIVHGLDTNGEPRALKLLTDGSLVISGGVGGSGGDGAILDGANALIKATVLDYANSNPLATTLVDTNGDPISVGGGTQYDEDTAAANAEKLTMAGVVRKDARGTLVSADGDRTELQVNANGDLRVDGSGVTQPVSGTFWQATQPISAASLPLPTGATTEATLSALSAKFPAALDADGGLKVHAQSAIPVTDNGGTLSIDDGAGSITVDGTFWQATQPVSGTFWQATQPVSGTFWQATQPVSVAAVVHVDDNAGSLTVDGSVSLAAAIPAGTNNIGDVDVLTLPALSAGTNNIGDVDVLTLPSIPAGNNNIGDVDIASGPTNGSALQVQGTAASDAAVSGNPVRVGGRASDAVPTAMSADGDAVDLWLTRRGAAIVSNAPHIAIDGAPFSLLSKTVQTTTTQTGSDVLTVTSGKKLVITSIQIQAGGTTAGTVQVWFGTNADTTYTRGTDKAIFDGEFAPSATLKPGFAQTGCWIGATDEELHLTTSAAINPLTITVWYYEIT